MRLAAAIAYRPALFFSDSWTYLDAAYSQWPVQFRPDRPSGYPLTLKALSLLGRNLTVVTTVQHLAGLATGALAYALMVRLRVNRWLAAAASALIMLDAYSIALEQHVMAETFFALSLVVAVFLAVAARPSPATLAASGAALALANTLRTGAIFALPVLLLFWWHAGGRRGAAAAVLGFVAPLACYFALQAADGYPVGFTQASGWFLYGRVAELTDCSHDGVRRENEKLCRLTQSAGDRGPPFFVWDPASPAHRLYGHMDDPRGNRALRRFALAVIRDRSLAYGRMVGRDSSYYFFDPPFPPALDGRNAISFPRARKQYLKGNPYFSDLGDGVHPPAAQLRAYQRLAHMPQPLLAALAVAALLGFALGTGSRWATLVPAGVALSILVGTTATTEFTARYVVPLTPLLVCAGTIGASAVWRRYSASRARSSPGARPPRSPVAAPPAPPPTSSP